LIEAYDASTGRFVNLVDYPETHATNLALTS
jgi:hypothetical protein